MNTIPKLAQASMTTRFGLCCSLYCYLYCSCSCLLTRQLVFILLFLLARCSCLPYCFVLLDVIATIAPSFLFPFHLARHLLFLLFIFPARV